MKTKKLIGIGAVVLMLMMILPTVAADIPLMRISDCPPGFEDVPGGGLPNEGMCPDLEGHGLMPYIPDQEMTPTFDGETSIDMVVDYETRYIYDDEGNWVGVVHYVYYADGRLKIIRNEWIDGVVHVWIYWTTWHWLKNDNKGIDEFEECNERSYLC